MYYPSLSRAAGEYIRYLEMNQPDASAVVIGGATTPLLYGIVDFYQTQSGVLVVASISGLPHVPGRCNGGVFGFHIHDGPECVGEPGDPFGYAGTHYDPYDCDHPHHAGDLPPLFENHGYAFMIVLSDWFTVQEVLGMTIIVHDHPDDMMTQPWGNAGMKIGCGLILATSYPGRDREL